MLAYFYWFGTSHAKTVVVKKQMKAIEKEHIIDMRQVTDYQSTDNGLQLYFADGTGYYWERGDK